MRTIPLTKGQTALVDDEDYTFLMQWKWCAKKNKCGFYAVRNRRKSELPGTSTIFMHVEIMGRATQAPISEEKDVDHNDLNRLNNQRGNLRICTRQENLMNRLLRRDSTTGYIGVSKKGNKFCAQIMLNRNKMYLGIHETSELAAQAYDKKAIELFGEYAKINFLTPRI